MLPQLKRDADGGLTLYIQNESPGKDKEANWLPAPKGPFFMAMRLYWPKAEALEGKWTAAAGCVNAPGSHPSQLAYETWSPSQSSRCLLSALAHHVKLRNAPSR